LRTVID